MPLHFGQLKTEGIVSHVPVWSVANFPEPVAGVITLEDHVAYEIIGTIDMGMNRIVCGLRSTLTGVDRFSDVLLFQAAGIAITVDPGKGSLICNSIGFQCPNGTLFHVDGSTLGLIECALANIRIAGEIHNTPNFVFRNCSLNSGITQNGFAFFGAGGTLSIRDNVAVINNAGILFDFGVATFQKLSVSRNFATINAGQAFIQGNGLNATIAGYLNFNIFDGVGTPVSGFNEETAKWVFTGNVGQTNTSVGFEVSVTFTAESTKIVVINNATIKATDRVLGLSIRHSLGPTNWILGNVVSVAAGTVSVLLVPQRTQGQSIREATITGTVYVGLVVSSKPI